MARGWGVRGLGLRGIRGGFEGGGNGGGEERRGKGGKRGSGLGTSWY